MSTKKQSGEDYRLAAFRLIIHNGKEVHFVVLPPKVTYNKE